MQKVQELAIKYNLDGVLYHGEFEFLQEMMERQSASVDFKRRFDTVKKLNEDFEKTDFLMRDLDQNKFWVVSKTYLRN